MGYLAFIGITVLGVIGFAVTGPVAGSVAAFAQSAFFGGSVTAGSWFAMAQSIAMAAPTIWFDFYKLFVEIDLEEQFS